MIWPMPRTTILTLRDSTGFHHTCGWTVLDVSEGDKFPPAFMYNIIYRNKNITFTINL
jgi:hypothetical protein